MNLESELKLQAYLDGELSIWRQRKVAAWVAVDPEAQNLVAELKMVKTALAEAEPQASLPETPEFYWSKIQRAIERGEQTAPAARPIPEFLVAWRRFLAPLAGVALVAF